MGTASNLGVSQHPLVKIQSRRLLVVALVYAALGMLMMPFSPLAGIGVMTVGGLLAARRYALGSLGQAVLLVNAAFERLTRGQDQEAEQILDGMPARTLRRRYIVRGARLLRATIAFHRGEPERTRELATACEKERFERLSVFTGQRPYEERVRAGALALRALAHASLGDGEAAERDAAAADVARGATPETLARSALARAVVLARKGDRSALAVCLGQSSGLILEWSTPRERALLRALRRMARARPKSVYREAAKPDDGAEEGRLAAWIATVAPGAAAFARDGAGHAEAIGSPGPVSFATPEAHAEVLRARTNATRARPSTPAWMMTTIVLWVVVVAAVLLALVRPTLSSAAQATHGPGTSWLPVWMVVAAFGVFAAGRFAALARFRGHARTLVLAQLDVARGKTREAEATLTALTRTGAAMSAAGAHLTLAQLAERQAAWSTVLGHCDRGIAQLSKTAILRAATSDLLLPELAAMRAFGLAAAGRWDEASAEMQVLDEAFPSYVHKARAHFRFRLMSAVGRGELETACEVARGRTPSLPLSIREDMLADVVLAATAVVSQDERERIDAELDDGQLRAWIDAVAPGLRERLDRRIGVPTERAVVPASSGDAASAEALEEALAEAETAGEGQGAARRQRSW